MRRYKMIRAKPTRYKRILFRSRLEARWAMYLDRHMYVQAWEYEPHTVTNQYGWTYTPDFLINSHLSPAAFYLEIKPSQPTIEYETNLLTFSSLLGDLLFLVYGDWYQVPFNIALLSSRKWKTNMLEKVNTMLFADEAAYDLAASHRFDLRRRRRR